MSVSEYAKEFTRLSKCAPRLVPNEAARVDRFRAGMMPPLYNALLFGDFPTLTKIVDRAKLWETKNKEAWAERDKKRKMRSGQSSKGRVKEPVFRSPLITKIEGAKGEDSHKLPQCNQHLQ